MRLATRVLFAMFMTVSACAAAPAGGAAAQALEPIVYTIRVPSPATHVAQVEAVVPTHGRATVGMMMPVYAILMLARAGLIDRDEFLSRLSWQIGTLQNAPGRRRQTLEQSSQQVWTNSTSGVNEQPNTVSDYVKGAVVGFLLDARIRRAASGARSLDDVVRLAYQRYSGARGFTEEQFRATASEVAGVDLSPWFHRTIASTDELGYGEAVGWYGLFFESAPNPKARWNLAVRPRATPGQRRQLQALLAPDRGR